MKKIIIVFLCFFAVLSAARSQILKAGVNFATISINDEGDVDENKVLTSFQVGFTGDIKILPILYFQPGILFTGKGAKSQSGSTGDATYFRASTNPYYIEIPATFVLKTPTGPVKLFAGVGPYIAAGIGGKNKVEGRFLGTEFKSESEIEWSNDDPGTLDYEEGAGYGIMKRFDYGVNATAGIQFTNTVLAVNYGHGLAKLQSGANSSGDDNSKHRVLSITLGIKL